MKGDVFQIETSTDVEVFLAPKDVDLVSFDYLHAKFYNEVIFEGAIQRPLAMCLNPEIDGKVIYSHVDIWLVIYRANFRVQIRRPNRAGVSGPHSVRLIYKSHQNGEIYWIATAQINEVFFYDQPELLGHLNLLIADRGFYQSEYTRKLHAAK